MRLIILLITLSLLVACGNDITGEAAMMAPDGLTSPGNCEESQPDGCPDTTLQQPYVCTGEKYCKCEDSDGNTYYKNTPSWGGNCDSYGDCQWGKVQTNDINTACEWSETFDDSEPGECSNGCTPDSELQKCNTDKVTKKNCCSVTMKRICKPKTKADGAGLVT